MALVLIASIGGIGGFMYMKSNKGKKKADAPDLVRNSLIPR